MVINISLVLLFLESLRFVIDAAKPGVSVLSLCEKGDAFIMAETGKVFKREKDMKKGETEMQMWLNACGSYESEWALN